MKIGLIGDYDNTVPAHRAIPIDLTNKQLGLEIEFEWIPTEKIKGIDNIAEYDGLWCVPASPYKNMEGVLSAIRYARENNIPFLGTCGGFQHAIVEYVRNVLLWADADHAETASAGARLVISPLACELVEKTNRVYFSRDSKIAAAYGQMDVVEGYRCRFGLNPDFENQLATGSLIISARDESKEVRAIELTNHPFFVATLFQPERAALQGRLSPLVTAFTRAICATKLEPSLYSYAVN